MFLAIAGFLAFGDCKNVILVKQKTFFLMDHPKFLFFLLGTF